jgi:hypothetical protein
VELTLYLSGCKSTIFFHNYWAQSGFLFHKRLVQSSHADQSGLSVGSLDAEAEKSVSQPLQHFP